MPKFRKKPVEVEAFNWSGPWQSAIAPDWLQEAFAKNGGAGSAYQESGGVNIITLEGAMHANNGDWIIRGVKGEIYPCKPDIFTATYEPVE